MLDDILNQLPEEQKTEAALDAFDKKANEHTRSVDGTGAGLRAGMKLIPVDEECIQGKAYGDFATYRGREYARVAFMDYDNQKVVFVPEGRLNFFGRIVDKETGEQTGDILQPEGGPAEAWRSAGSQASLKARVIALSEAFYNEKYGRPRKACAYILVKEPRKGFIEPRPWDDAETYVDGEVFDFVGCSADGKEIW